MRKISRKGQLNLSFGWLFAIIIGATILFFAIYGATKIINSSRQTQQVVGAKEIGILLNPLETSFESAYSTSLSVPARTRIYNACSSSGNFGEQLISLSEESFGKFPPALREISFQNKYIFSRDSVEGKNFYIFSKPFEFPFKVTDVIYLTSSEEKYCFDDAPENIEDELNDLGQENLVVGCEDNPEYIKVCFGGSGCDFYVDYHEEYVRKGQDKLYFKGDPLMYAAIFSKKDSYECQVKRLAKRAKGLAKIYQEKSILVSQRNCKTDVGEDLNILINKLEQVEQKGSSALSVIDVESIENKNSGRCKLW